MFASATLWVLAVEKDTIGSDVTRVIYHPLYGAGCEFNFCWIDPALEDELMRAAIELKGGCIHYCSRMVRGAVDTFPN